jgi:hypothetical protein
MIALILLALNGKVPDRLYRAMCRAYGLASDAKLRYQAGLPHRYRLMVSDGCDAGEERVRYVDRYQIPIATSAEAVARLTEGERLHPEYTWWIEPGDGRRERRMFPSFSDRSEDPGAGGEG